MNAEEYLIEGVKILGPFMRENGFDFEFVESGKASGGYYSWGKYKKENRILELHFRYSLGCIEYRIGDKRLSHLNYMKMLGVYGKNKYPGFSNDPLQAFRDLLYDLKTFSTDFIFGLGKDFEELALRFEQNPDQFSGFKSLPK
jgi:hypothetical protein